MGGQLLELITVVEDSGGGGGGGGPNLVDIGGGGGGGGAGETEAGTGVGCWTDFVGGGDVIVTEDFFTFSGIAVTGLFLICNGPWESIYLIKLKNYN